MTAAAERTTAARGAAAVLPTYPPRAATFVRGAGTHLYDEAGHEYLDLVAGIAVVALGHGHPAPIEALTRQAAVLGHVSNLYWTEPAVRLAERLAELSGMTGGSYLCNSGAEAVEAAIKLARRRGRARGGPDRHEIVCLEGAFHGRTLGALAATWARAKREPFEPLPAGFRHVPRNDVAALTAAVGPRTAGILLEPVQGEGGVHPLEPSFLAAARELADRHDALLCSTRSRPASDAAAPGSRGSTRASSPTRWRWPRGSAPGCRWRARDATARGRLRAG
jgi:acetylornithine/succinyldiaminopimelate/putrescine aminotransferase